MAMQCPHCQLEHPAEMKFCPTTGKPVDLTLVTCPNCGRGLLPGSKYCATCGAPVGSKDPLPLPEKKQPLTNPASSAQANLEQHSDRDHFSSNELAGKIGRRNRWETGSLILGIVILVGLIGFGLWWMRTTEQAEMMSFVNTPTLPPPIPTHSPAVQPSATPPQTPTQPEAPTPASVNISPTGDVDEPLLPTPAADWPYNLVFASNRDGNFNIILMDADNPQEWLAVPMPEGYENAYWPGFCERQVAFEVHDYSLALPRWIYLFDLATQTTQPFAPPGELPERTGLPSCSPSGRYLAYIAYRLFDWSLNVLDRQANRLIFQEPEGIYPMLGYPRWPASEDTLVWMGIRSSGTFDVNRTSNLLSGTQPLTELIFKGKFPSLSPDGTQLAYVCGNRFSLCVVDVSSGALMFEKPINYTRPFNDQMAPASTSWSSDGEWIYYVSSATGNWDIYRVRPDGSDMQNLTESWPSDELMPAAR